MRAIFDIAGPKSFASSGCATVLANITATWCCHACTKLSPLLLHDAPDAVKTTLSVEESKSPKPSGGSTKVRRCGQHASAARCDNRQSSYSHQPRSVRRASFSPLRRSTSSLFPSAKLVGSVPSGSKIALTDPLCGGV